MCTCFLLFFHQSKYHFCISFQLDWPTKLFLAHGVVRGMEYLHSIRPDPVIHGDLKLQNVLVGDGLVTKVWVIVQSYTYMKTKFVLEYYVSFYHGPR